MTSLNDFTLRRTMTPYVGELVIVGAIMIGMVALSLKTSSWPPLGVALIGCCLLLVTHYADLRYRVFWRDGTVERITANNIKTTIKAFDISHVVLEQSTGIGMLALRRPVRRITIYGKGEQHLDVSLRHFALDDIRRLMEVIHKMRPDLALPII
jgi:hypothetical protein